jgi:adenosylcobyric acid synthase
VADLKWLRAAGWENYAVQRLRRGGWVLGVCGGYQMLGRRIIDHDRVESDQADTVGLGLLDIDTIFTPRKVPDRVTAIHLPTGFPITGYEIHCGRISGVTAANALFRIESRGQSAVREFDGARSADGRVIGTSIHGLFDGPEFRRGFVDMVRQSRDLGPLADPARAAAPSRDDAFDRLADLLEAHVDMRRVAAVAGLDWKF